MHGLSFCPSFAARQTKQGDEYARFEQHQEHDHEDGQTLRYGVVLAVSRSVFGALALLAGNITNALTRVAGYIT